MIYRSTSGWLPTTERSSIWVTTNPYGETFKHLSHLIRYPYGCMEQTVSSRGRSCSQGLRSAPWTRSRRRRRKYPI